MTQYELSHYYGLLSSQAIWMAKALVHYRYGNEQQMWYCLMLWAYVKQEAREIADAHDTMSFAKAMGVADGIKKAWE